MKLEQDVAHIHGQVQLYSPSVKKHNIYDRKMMIEVNKSQVMNHIIVIIGNSSSITDIIWSAFLQGSLTVFVMYLVPFAAFHW